MRRIIVGITPPEKLKEIIAWMGSSYAVVLSLDVEEVLGYRYDEYELVGIILYDSLFVEC